MRIGVIVARAHIRSVLANRDPDACPSEAVCTIRATVPRPGH